MSLENDNSNAAPVEKQRPAEHSAKSSIESASTRSVHEAYEELGRQSSMPGYSQDAFRNGNTTGDQAGDPFKRAQGGLEAVGVTDNTQPRENERLTRRIGPRGEGSLAPEPRDKGVTWMHAGEDRDFSATYNPNERNDRRATLEQGAVEGGIRQTQTFDGRQDGLARQETFEKGSTYEGSKRYEPGKGRDGILTETVSGDTSTGDVTRNRTFEAARNPQQMASESVSVRSGIRTTERAFEGRPDGMLFERTVQTRAGEEKVQTFADGQLRTVPGPDGSPVTTAYDKDGNVLKEGLPSQRQAAEQRDAGEKNKDQKLDPKDPKQIEDHLKQFEADLNKKNELPALRKGEGPYQALQRAVKEGLIAPMSHKDMLAEARRIRDRDMQGDKKHYKQGEKLHRETPDQIKQKVEQERQRLQGDQRREAAPVPPPDEQRPPRPPEGDRQQPPPQPPESDQQKPKPPERPPAPPEGGQERGREGTDQPPRPDTPEGRLQASRERLARTADTTFTNPEDRQRFERNMRTFEERARTERLSPDEVAKTYDSLDRMMTAPQGERLPSAEQRALLAQNFMHHAADPRNIDQGQNNTCNVTTMQEHMMTRTPSKMADMLEQASTRGTYRAADGTEIKLDPRAMQPIRGLDSAVPQDNTRSYATQILNHAMVNDITQRGNPPRFYTQITNGRDEQGNVLAANDSGERLREGGFDGKNITDNKGGHQPQVSIFQMNEAMRRYTGENGNIAIAANTFREDAETPNMTQFRNPQELAEQIQRAQREGRMPLIIMVDGNHPALTGGQGQSREWNPHVVSIRGFNPQTGEVEISNQWGQQNDRRISLETLHQMSKPPERTTGQQGQSQQERQQQDSHRQQQKQQERSIYQRVIDYVMPND